MVKYYANEITKIVSSCTKKCFSVKHEHCHGTNKCHPRKQWFLKECHGAQKYLMTSDVIKDKETIKSIYMHKTDLFKERKEYGKLIGSFSHAR